MTQKGLGKIHHRKNSDPMMMMTACGRSMYNRLIRSSTRKSKVTCNKCLEALEKEESA